MSHLENLYRRGYQDAQYSGDGKLMQYWIKDVSGIRRVTFSEFIATTLNVGDIHFGGTRPPEWAR